VCAGVQKNTIEGVNNAIRKRGIICVSPQYINNYTDLLFQCKHGHRWEATPHNIIICNSGCPVCYKSAPRKIKHNLKVFQKIAAKRKGVCLSKEYLGSRQNLEFRCERGHLFHSRADNVLRGQWCQQCGYIEEGIKKTRKRRSRGKHNNEQ